MDTGICPIFERLLKIFRFQWKNVKNCHFCFDSDHVLADAHFARSTELFILDRNDYLYVKLNSYVPLCMLLQVVSHQFALSELTF